MLLIGVVRFGIERTWDIATFGKVSLTLSASKLVLLFINAVGVVIYPVLRRTDENKYKDIYNSLRDFLMLLLLGVLLVYYPFKTILSLWLPQYAESLKYMALLFPIIIYEGKMALLINTYLKVLRKENTLLHINIILLLFSTIITFFTTFIIKNLDLAMLSILIIVAIRNVYSELLLSGMLKLSMMKDIFYELILTVVFIFSGWFINSWYTALIYGFAFVTYAIIKKNDFKESLNFIRTTISATSTS